MSSKRKSKPKNGEGRRGQQGQVEWVEFVLTTLWGSLGRSLDFI